MQEIKTTGAPLQKKTYRAVLRTKVTKLSQQGGKWQDKYREEFTN